MNTRHSPPMIGPAAGEALVRVVEAAHRYLPGSSLTNALCEAVLDRHHGQVQTGAAGRTLEHEMCALEALVLSDSNRPTPLTREQIPTLRREMGQLLSGLTLNDMESCLRIVPPGNFYLAQAVQMACGALATRAREIIATRTGRIPTREEAGVVRRTAALTRKLPQAPVAPPSRVTSAARSWRPLPTPAARRSGSQPGQMAA